VKLTGTCNKCGLCCYDELGAKCLNLEVVKTPGQPQATRCRVYDKRYDGMPIILQHPTDGSIRGGTCRLNSTAETLSIIETGFGKGCSLKVAEAPFSDQEKHHP